MLLFKNSNLTNYGMYVMIGNIHQFEPYCEASKMDTTTEIAS